MPCERNSAESDVFKLHTLYSDGRQTRLYIKWA